jgi:hypothetical protein
MLLKRNSVRDIMTLDKAFMYTTQTDFLYPALDRMERTAMHAALEARETGRKAVTTIGSVAQY